MTPRSSHEWSTGVDNAHPFTPIRESFLHRCSLRIDSSVSFPHHITFTSFSFDSDFSPMHAKLLSVILQQNATESDRSDNPLSKHVTPRSVIELLSRIIDCSLGVSTSHALSIGTQSAVAQRRVGELRRIADIQILQLRTALQHAFESLVRDGSVSTSQNQHEPTRSEAKPGARSDFEAAEARHRSQKAHSWRLAPCRTTKAASARRPGWHGDSRRCPAIEASGSSSPRSPQTLRKAGNSEKGTVSKSNSLLTHTRRETKACSP